MTHTFLRKNSALALIAVLSVFVAAQSFMAIADQAVAQAVQAETQTQDVLATDADVIAVSSSSSSIGIVFSASASIQSSFACFNPTEDSEYEGLFICHNSSSSFGTEFSASASIQSSFACDNATEDPDHEGLFICHNSSSSLSSSVAQSSPADTATGDASSQHTGGGHGSHSGQDTTRLRAIVKFVANNGLTGIPDGAFGGGVSGPFSADEQVKMCSIKKAKFISDMNIVVDSLAQELALVFGRPDPAPIKEFLMDSGSCADVSPLSMDSQNLVAIRINADGYLVTSNPVVNACMRGKATLGLIQHNTDTVMHRQGSVITYRPRTCSDYHKGSDNVWLHPDYLSVHVMLNEKGQVMEDQLSKDVVVLRDAGPDFVAIGNVASR
jgi:hypothetical protein